jgi:hypothetical protein
LHRRTALLILSTGSVIAAALLCGSLAPHRLAGAWWHLRESLFIVVPFIGLTLAGLAIAAWALDAPNDRAAARRAIPSAVVLALFACTWIWWAASWHQYRADRIYYTASVTIAAGPLPALSTRVPYQMATAQARSNLGDVVGNIRDAGTTYLPRRAEYSTLVERKGWLAGYEAVLTQSLGETGESTSYTCRFDHDEAGLRGAGWWTHNLAREINSHNLGVRYDPADLWGYCAGTVPHLVVPLKRQTGWWYVTERPAGYADYNGRTGALVFHRDAEADGERPPGPTYPLSIAARQREALLAPGGYADWRTNRTGWEPDPEDVNSGNSTEFTLGRGAGRDPVYVTPLTGRGSATAISAFAAVDATTTRPGTRLATLTLYRADPAWKSTKALESRVKTDYQDLPNWQNVRLFELAPTGGDGWVATIGVRDGNTISYRVRGNGTLTGATATCLHHPETGAKLRCGRQYVAGDPPAPGQGPPGAGPGLSGYTDEQIVGELRRRLGGG